MATKVVIESYVDSLIGASGTKLSDSLLLGGMEDVVRKLELTNPKALRELETTSTISSTPVTLHYIPPILDVYVDDDRAVLRDNKSHIANPYSLLNDFGETTYYWVTGNKLHIHPFDADKDYSYRGIVYAVSNGVLTWADRLNYPLALYCGSYISYSNIVEAINGLITDASTYETGSLNDSTLSNVMPSAPNNKMNALYNRVVNRLDSHDIELSSAEIELVKTQIAAYQAMQQKDYTMSMKLQSRAAIFDKWVAMFMTLKQQYNEWFGVGGKE